MKKLIENYKDYYVTDEGKVISYKYKNIDLKVRCND